MTCETLLRNLNRPTGPVDVVLDTDAYNEIDDQYAISYLLKSAAGDRVKALYAAPFFNENSSSPEDGMIKSYHEILHLLDLAGFEDMKKNVFKGSTGYLKSETEPVVSDAAQDLARRAMEYTPENPLYVIAIGAITNVASAILINPEIIDRIVIVWLGGNAWHWTNNKEFNLMQDVAAARVIFGCGAPLVQLPCMGVVSAFTISQSELEKYLLGKNPLCTYLVEHTIDEVNKYAKGLLWTRVIWDVTAIDWVLDWKNERIFDTIEHAPIPQYDHHFSFGEVNRPFMRYVYHINRDGLFRELFRVLTL